MDFKEMEYDELRNLIEAANIEMAARRKSMQKEAWEAVKKAISDYIWEFDEISLDHGEYYILGACDFSTPGMIITYEEEEEDY